MKRLGFHTLRDKATDTLGDRLSQQLQEDVAPKMSDEEAFSFAGFNANIENFVTSPFFGPARAILYSNIKGY